MMRIYLINNYPHYEITFENAPTSQVHPIRSERWEIFRPVERVPIQLHVVDPLGNV
jgi:hypothetical protein